MASILALKTPLGPLDRILNVDHHVGPTDQSVNNADDVEAVQRLLVLAARVNPKTSRFGKPAVTRAFDALTGFWIYRYQQVQANLGQGGVIDGVVSPARGTAYGAGAKFWTI